MKIVVCVKYVPDSQADRRFTDGGVLDRAGVEGRLSELDEYAVEAALVVAGERPGTTVTALCVGPEGAVDALRPALQMGADEAVHVLDDALAGSDAPATALVLARALERLGPDLVLTGMASTDGTMGVVPAMVAEHLGLPQATYALTVEAAGDTVRIEREDGDTTDVLEVDLPALVGVTDRTNEPRYPSFRQIMAARRKAVTTWSLADLGVDPSLVGAAGARTVVVSAVPRPPRGAGQVVVDEGDGAVRLVEFLAAARLL